jgi:23S rRNA (uracil1939-C5)-methyltransferase
MCCDVQTFARDARILVNGGYKLRELHTVDQFKWSVHIELVGHFTR